MIDNENMITVHSVVTHPAKDINKNPWVVANGVQSLIDKVSAGKYEPIPTGVENFDRILGGGFIAEQLVGISGRPGAGKTAFGQWLTESMALNSEGYSCLYFCYEMSREQLQARSISRLLYGLGKDLTPLEVLRGKDGWREGAEIYAKMYAEKVLYVGMGNGIGDVTLETLEKTYREFADYNKRQGKPSPIFVVDYLQLVSVAGCDEKEAISEVMARIKGLAVEYNTVGLVVLANNRESNKTSTKTNKTDDDADMFSGRGSSSIEYGLDAMLALLPNETEANNHSKNVTVTLKVVKGRWVEYKASASFKFNGKHMSYIPVDCAGEVLTPREQKVATDLYNMMENETKLFK